MCLLHCATSLSLCTASPWTQMPTALSWPEHVLRVPTCRHAELDLLGNPSLCFVLCLQPWRSLPKKTVDKTLLWQGKSGICLRVVMESSRPVATRHVQFQSWRMYRVPNFYMTARIMPFGQWCIGSFVEFQPLDMSGTVVSFVLLGSVSILGGGCPSTGSRVDFPWFPFSGRNEPLGSHKMALASALKIRYPKR